MVGFSNVSSIENVNGINFKPVERVYAVGQEEDNDVSIFTSQDAISQANADILSEKLTAVEDKQGIFSKGWNSFKELTNLGTSAEKCNAAIEQYKNGEISFEEASEIIDNFDSKQSSSLNLFSNIATSAIAIGAVALAAALSSTGIGIPAAIAIGAGAGALTKATYKLSDRATNNIDGDALNGRQIARDALSGAVTGGMAAGTMGTGTAGCAKEAIISGAKTGIKTGAIAGSSNYVIDCAFDEDKEFNFKDFAETTLVSAGVGGVVGGAMGGINATLHTKYENFGGCNLKAMTAKEASNATTKNVITNSASSASYKILNDRIRSVAHFV